MNDAHLHLLVNHFPIIGTILGYLKTVEGLDTSKFRYYHNGILNGLAV